ncbi:MAG: hypothetical protein ACTHU0_08785 [Kofleriaceae bacterium]
MFRVWLVLLLTVAPAAAWAQRPAPARIVVEEPQAATTRARDQASAAEHRVGQLALRRSAFDARYAKELAAIDRIKKQKRSWRRDRELQDALAEANETAGQLQALVRQLADAQAELARARQALVAAIDAELASGAIGARAQLLARMRLQVAPARHAVRRIVMPDMKIDPYADPEELDQQAAAFREAEAALQRQVVGLEEQHKELQAIAELRVQHDRSIELDRRDDNTPRRGPGSASRTPGLGPPPEVQPRDDLGGGVSMFEADAAAVLADVVDVSITDGLTRAQRSNDPAQRAAAVGRARDAVATQLERLRKKRAEIERAARDRRR